VAGVYFWHYASPSHQVFTSIYCPFPGGTVGEVNPVAYVLAKAYHGSCSFGIAYLETLFIAYDLDRATSAFLSSLLLAHL
jgi:hypothetical protein